MGEQEFPFGPQGPLPASLNACGITIMTAMNSAKTAARTTAMNAFPVFVTRASYWRGG